MERLHGKPNKICHWSLVIRKSRLGGVYETQQNLSLVIGHWSLEKVGWVEFTKPNKICHWSLVISH